jgi:hypothetical protein
MLAIGIYDDGIQTLTTRYLDETLVLNQFKKKYGFDGRVPDRIIILQNGRNIYNDPTVLKVIVGQ